jgi:hypothetical protein
MPLTYSKWEFEGSVFENKKKNAFSSLVGFAPRFSA